MGAETPDSARIRRSIAAPARRALPIPQGISFPTGAKILDGAERDLRKPSDFNAAAPMDCIPAFNGADTFDAKSKFSIQTNRNMFIRGGNFPRPQNPAPAMAARKTSPPLRRNPARIPGLGGALRGCWNLKRFRTAERYFPPPYRQTEKVFVNRFAFQRADYPAKPAFDCRRIPAAAAVYPRIRALRLAGAKPNLWQTAKRFRRPGKASLFSRELGGNFLSRKRPAFFAARTFP